MLLAGNVMDVLKRKFNPDDLESFFTQLIKDVNGITGNIYKTIAKVDFTLKVRRK